MNALEIVTPANPAYKGRTLGVDFSHGRAVVLENNIPPLSGAKTLKELAQRFRDFPGYDVVVHQDEPVRQSAERSVKSKSVAAA